MDIHFSSLTCFDCCKKKKVDFIAVYHTNHILKMLSLYGLLWDCIEYLESDWYINVSVHLWFYWKLYSTNILKPQWLVLQGCSSSCILNALFTHCWCISVSLSLIPDHIWVSLQILTDLKKSLTIKPAHNICFSCCPISMHFSSQPNKCKLQD